MVSQENKGRKAEKSGKDEPEKRALRNERKITHCSFKKDVSKHQGASGRQDLTTDRPLIFDQLQSSGVTNEGQICINFQYSSCLKLHPKFKRREL